MYIFVFLLILSSFIDDNIVKHLRSSLLHLPRYANVTEMVRLAFADTQPLWDQWLQLWHQKTRGNVNAPDHTTPTPSLNMRKEFKKQAPPSDGG